MNDPLDPRKSVFYQRYLRLQYAQATSAKAHDSPDKSGAAGFGSKIGQFSKVDRAAVRRGQIYGGKSDGIAALAKDLKRYPKKSTESAFIREALKANYLFKTVNDVTGADGLPSALQTFVDCMHPVKIEAGNNIITQGDTDNENMCFYILQTGKALVLVDLKPVSNYESGSGFGELALIYNAPRAASVRATEECHLWALDFKTFKTIQASTELSKVQSKVEFLKKCNFLDALSNELITKLSGAVEEREFQAGEYIIKQGEWFLDEEAVAAGKDVYHGDPLLQTKQQEFYIIQEGKVRCNQLKASGKEVTLVTLESGQHFGEMALLTDEPRRASCIADGHVRCLSLSRENFKLMLGPINVVLEQRMRIRILQSVPILQSIAESKLLLMSQAMKIETFKNNEYIIRQGDPGNAFYIIHEGHVRCTTVEPGPGHKEVERVRLEPGEFFGERALIKNEPRKANVIAVGDVECLVLTKEQYREYMSTEVHERVAGRDYMGGKDGVGGHGHAPVASHVPPDMVEQKQITHYKLDDLHMMRTLGTGTFGRVKLVRPKDAHDVHVYALKCMRKKDVVEKKQEANILAEKSLLFSCGECPFILKLFQTFNAPNSLYMLMEFVQGGELWSYLYDAKRAHVLPRNPFRGLHLEAVKFYTSNVLYAFQHMHKQHIAYRDLKPENLLVNDKGYLKVVDFGFAKKIPFTGSDGKVSNKTFTLCGTPEYLAPEIVLSRGYDKSVDCWALGCLTYELYFNKTPFAEPGDPNQVIFRKIVESETLLSDSRLFPAPVDPNFKALVQKMLRSNSSLRLGNTSGGLDDVKAEPLFGPDFHWSAIAAQTHAAPFRPIIKDKLDAQCFEHYPEEDADTPFHGDQQKFWSF